MDPHLCGLGAVHLLPEQNPKVAEGQQAPEGVAGSVLQRAAHQQGVVQQGVVEDRQDLHVLWER